jgi:dipeptidyl aminopeptidase/acylaminoacyl peptidase
MKVKVLFKRFIKNHEVWDQSKRRSQSIKFRTCTFAFIALLFFVLLNANAQTKRSFTVDDELNMVRIGSALMSPDGRQVFYSKTELDWAKNKSKTTHYMVSANGGKPQQYIGDAGGGSFQFSPDGKYLSFTRKAEKYSQLYLLPTSGGEAVRVTNHQGGVGSYQWSKDGRKIFFSAEETLSDKEQKEYDLGADPIFIDEGPNGKNKSSWNNLWEFDIATKKERRITNEELLFGDFDVSPNGKRIVFSARRENRVNHPYRAELFIADVKTGKVTRLTDNDAPEDGPKWAPDGKTFLYRAPSDVDYYLTSGHFWAMNPDTKDIRKYEHKIGTIEFGWIWMPDGKSILFNELRRTNSNLYRMDIKTGKVTAITDIKGNLRAIAFSKDRKKMVYSFTDFTTPRDIYVSPVGSLKPIRLTNANPWIKEEILLAKGDVIRWKSKGEMEIEGVFYLPGDYQEGTRIPLMLFIHGGPPGHFENGFRGHFHMYTGLGYAVLAPNVRGSDSYGDKILRGLIGEVGDGEFIDQMSGVDHVIELGYVDPDQLGIRGGSWGGVSSGYTITQTDRFKAASVICGVCNWAAEVGPGFSFDVGLWYIGGKPWTNREEWVKRSSITHVTNVTKTAVLFIHGAEDQTSSVGQSLMYSSALMDIGKVPVRYIKFPREGHGFNEPRHRRIFSVEEIKWMQKYVRGIEWEPWKRDSDQ